MYCSNGTTLYFILLFFPAANGKGIRLPLHYGKAKSCLQGEHLRTCVVSILSGNRGFLIYFDAEFDYLAEKVPFGLSDTSTMYRKSLIEEGLFFFVP